MVNKLVSAPSGDIVDATNTPIGGGDLTLGETDTTAYRGDRGAIAYNHSQLISVNPHAVTKSEVGLGDVDNTSDATKDTAIATLANKTLTSPILNDIISGDAFLDEDDMVSDSATKLASQQSIKKYVDDATAGGGGPTIETLTLALPISGPFVATTMSVTFVRIQTAPTESIVTMRTTTINETGNSTNEEILINATSVPARFRPTSDQRFVGMSTVQAFSNNTGWMNAANTDYWRFWRDSAGNKWNTAGAVRVYATCFTWISV